MAEMPSPGRHVGSGITILVDAGSAARKPLLSIEDRLKSCRATHPDKLQQSTTLGRFRSSPYSYEGPKKRCFLMKCCGRLNLLILSCSTQFNKPSK